MHVSRLIISRMMGGRRYLFSARYLTKLSLNPAAKGREGLAESAAYLRIWGSSD
jgi:hypothetical protein